MARWSAENATKAYLKTMKMGERAKEPDIAEFISALAAGNNTQLMVAACGGAASSATSALAAAAHQTGGRVVCIFPSKLHLISFQKSLIHEYINAEFVVGEAQYLLTRDYKEADFMIIDCKLEDHEDVFRAVQIGERRKNTIILGYNAFCKGSWASGGSKTQLLPIGEGLLIKRVYAKPDIELKKTSRWIVRVDQCTGEEHVFRVKFSDRKVIEA